MTKSYQKPRPSLINIVRTLLRRMEWFRSGLPNFIYIHHIHDIVLNDPKVKVCEIAEIISISTELLDNILHIYLCMKKLCARWVLQLLTINQKRIRISTSEQNWAYFNRNPKEFLRRFETMDETRIHHYTPESREGSKQ